MDSFELYILDYILSIPLLLSSSMTYSKHTTLDFFFFFFGLKREQFSFFNNIMQKEKRKEIYDLREHQEGLYSSS